MSSSKPPKPGPQPQNLALMFHENALRWPQRPVLHYKKDGRWRWLRWATLARTVQEIAGGLLASKLRHQEPVALMAANGPLWVAADLAILSAGGVSVPIYATHTPRQVAHVLADCGARFVFVGSEAHLVKVLEVAPDLPQLKAIITLENIPARSPLQLSLAQLREKAAQTLRDALNDALRKNQPQDLATLIYTSGATGEPRGVMLTHGAILANLAAIARCFPVGEEDVGLSFLPLSHSFERTAGYYLPLFRGGQIAFSERMDTVMDDMAVVRPTVMTAVPRFYEKFHAAALAEIEAQPTVGRALMRVAVDIGMQRAEGREARHWPNPVLEGAWMLARQTAFARIHEKTGGRLRFFVGGGAPLSQEVVEFFHAAGLPIYEGYGLTEAAPVLTANRPGAWRFGTVGKPLPGVEIRVSADGEILARGANLMRGYFNQPQETAEALVDGWLHTGDLGHLDAEGFLHLTGRKKDILITAGGKNVSPSRLETLLAASPLVDQAVVVGDGRKYLAALLVPDFDALLSWAANQGLGAMGEGEGHGALLAHESVRRAYQDLVDQVNAGLPSYETLKQFSLLPRRLSMEAGELTPTLKVRRHVVESRYYADIEAMYPDAATPTDE